MRAGIQMYIEGLGVQRVPDKLVLRGVGLLAVRPAGKNALILTVRRKDCEKVFAILRDSCYNIKKQRAVGGWRLAARLRRRAGLLMGCLMAVAAVWAAQTRVLRVDVVGSGAYYRAEVLRLLEEEGIKRFSAPPAPQGELYARIFALPHVTFCALRHEGGILTVEIAAEGEASPLCEEWLYAPSDGVVEELIVVRGTPVVAEGARVRAGELLVSGEENGRRIYVMAQARIRCEIDVCFPGTRERALARAYLAYGATAHLSARATEDGWRIFGYTSVTCGVNLP